MENWTFVEYVLMKMMDINLGQWSFVRGFEETCMLISLKCQNINSNKSEELFQKKGYFKGKGSIPMVWNILS